jgi:general secretion pathway protein G
MTTASPGRLHFIGLHVVTSDRATMIQLSSPRLSRAFSLLELMAALAVGSILVVISTSAYSGYVNRTKITQAKADIGNLQVALERFHTDHFRYPDTLAEAGLSAKLDPYGNAYQYMNLTNLSPGDKPRKDGKDHPINTDFDLYSMGKDGKTKPTLNAKESQDDIVRARDGSFIDLAEKF